MDEREQLEALRRMKELQDREQPEPSMWDSVKSAAGAVADKAKLVGSAAVKGLGSTVAGALDTMSAQPDFGDVLRARMGQKRTFDDSAPFSRKLEEFGYQPKDTSEKYVDSIIRGATGALVGPGAVTGPVKALITGAASGLGSQAAGDMPGVKDTKYETAARFVGGLAGGIGAGTLASQKKNTGALAAEVLGDANPIDLDKAKDLMVKARMAGVPLNASQAMPNPSNIDNAVNTLTKTREGQVLIDQLREQPRQSRILADRLNEALPGQVRGNQVVANTSQEAATEALKQARAARTAATAPLFAQAGDMPEDALKAAIAKVSAAAAEAPDTNKGKLLASLSDVLQKAKDRAAPTPSGFLDVRGNPIMNPGKPVSMDEVNASMRSQLSNAKNINMSSSANDREAIGGLQTMIGGLRDDMGAVSPKFKQANDLYSEISANRVDPLKKGVIGDVAGLSGAVADKSAVEKITGVLKAGRNPKAPAADSEILQFAAETKAQPEVFRDAVKTHIANAIADADKQVANAQAPTFSKALEKSLLGDANQRQGFKDMLNGIEMNSTIPMKPNSLYKGLLNGMKILNAAGKRPGSIGPSSSDLAEVAGQSKIAETGRFLNWNAFAHGGGKVSRWLSADAYRKLAEGLSSPEGLENLQKLAKVPMMSPAAKVIVDSMLATEAASNPPGLQPSNPTEEQGN